MWRWFFLMTWGLLWSAFFSFVDLRFFSQIFGCGIAVVDWSTQVTRPCFFMINSNFEMVESVSFHGTHCPFWLSALHYAQGMWPQAFRYISPAATSWPQRVSRSSARRMLPSDSQRWVEHVGTISWRYVKTNSSEMYKRLKKIEKSRSTIFTKRYQSKLHFQFMAGFCHGFQLFPMVFPWIPMDSQEWNGPFTQPSAYCSRLTARYMWTAWVTAWLRCASGRRWILFATSTSRMGSFETCLDLVWKMENDWWILVVLFVFRI